MKKHVFIILITSLLLLCACQPTPQEEVVVNKGDQQQMLEKAQETAAPSTAAMPVTEHIQESFSEHGVSVEVDATVAIPNMEMPVVRVHGIDFSQETVDRFWNVLIGETTMYDLFSGSEKDAPQCGATLKTRDDGVTLLGAIEHPYGEWWKTDGKYFHVLNNRETPYSKGKPLTYDATLQYRYDHSDEEFYEDALDCHPIADLAAVPEGMKLSMTPNEAMQRAAEWIERLEIPFAPIRVMAVRNEAKQDAYLVECARIVNGVPMAVMDGYSLDSETAITVYWNYENFKILLSEDDLLALKWESPIEADETVVETAQLLSFDAIMDVFRKMMPIRYASSFEGRTEVFHIREIRLELVRILKQNMQNSGLLIPVWCFYGTNKTEADSPDWVSPETYDCQLMLNAIDGSIIDRDVGY